MLDYTPSQIAPPRHTTKMLNLSLRKNVSNLYTHHHIYADLNYVVAHLDYNQYFFLHLLSYLNLHNSETLVVQLVTHLSGGHFSSENSMIKKLVTSYFYLFRYYF